MPRIGLIVFMLALAGSVLGADYRLTVNATPEQLAKAKGIRLFGLKLEKGDRILSVSAGKTQGGQGLRAVLDNREPSGSVLADTLEGFGGKVTAGSGAAPSQGLVASLDVAPAAAAVASMGALDKIRGFVSSPLGYVSLGIFTLLAVAGFLFRPRKTVSGEKYHLPNRRKSIDETLKDIQRRLEKVDENQHELVRKPPVLRTFKGQIDAFNSRLNHLEAQLNSLQLHAAKHHDSIQDLDRGQKEVKSHIDKGFAGSVLDLKSSIDQAKQLQAGRLDEVLSSYGKQSLDLQSRLAELEKHGDEKLQAAVAGLTQALAQVQTAIAEKQVDLTPVESGLGQLKADVGEVRKAQDGLLTNLSKAIQEASPQGLVERLDALAASVSAVGKELESHDYAASLSELRTALSGLSDKSESGQKNTASAFESLLKEFKALQEANSMQAQALEAKVSELLSNPGSGDEKLDQLLVGVELLKKTTDDQSREFETKLKEWAPKPDGSDAKLDLVLAEVSGLASNAEPNQEFLLRLQAQLEELRGMAAQQAESIEAKIAEISARTDQRETILLSLQNRVAEVDGKADGNAEVLPLVADLRLELQSLAADQAKVSAAVEAATQAVAKAGADTDAKVDALSAGLASIASALENLPAGGSAALANEDGARFAKELSELRASLANAPAAADGALASELAEIKGVLASLKGSSGFTTDVEELRSALQNIQQPAALTAELAEIKAALAEMRNVAPVAAPEDPGYGAAIETLSANFSEWRAASEATSKNLEERLMTAISEVEASVNSAEPVTVKAAGLDEHAFDAIPEPEPEHPLEIEIVAEAPASDEEEEESKSEWLVLGGSASRRWSAPADCALSVPNSEKPLTPLTPTITPAMDAPIGPALYMGKKILYGHGTVLRGTWPGKGSVEVQLQDKLPNDAWRLTALDGHAFCAEEDQVEVASIASGRVVSRFSGTYIDQLTTDSHWIGLASFSGQLQLDYRSIQGRKLGEFIQIPAAADEARALVAEGERVFLGTIGGRIIRVENGKVDEIVAGGFGLISLTTHKTGLIALVREGGKDQVRHYSYDGKLLKSLDFEFALGFEHPVLIGDRLYLLGGGKLSTCNVKKLDVTHSVDLAVDRVTAFSGLFRGEQHTLVVGTAEKEQPKGKILLVDPKSGSTSVVCDVNEPQLYVLPADSKIAVATSCFYQNAIRVFDPFKTQSAQKAA